MVKYKKLLMYIQKFISHTESKYTSGLLSQLLVVIYTVSLLVRPNLTSEYLLQNLFYCITTFKQNQYNSIYDKNCTCCMKLPQFGY